jgi:MIP family channel proteins
MLDYRKLTAEAVGTFALIFMGAGSIIASQGTNLVAIALAHGLAIAVLVSTLGHVSGGVFNPALTIGLWATRRLSAVDAAGYIAAQLAGAVLGAVFLVATFPSTARELVNLGTPVLASGVGFAEGALVEVVLTFFLMLAVFGTAIDPRGPRVGGLFVGLVFTMDIATGFGLTGAAMNPARTFGPALLSGTWDNHLVYWVGPILGAVSAAMLYHYVFEDEEDATA